MIGRRWAKGVAVALGVPAGLVGAAAWAARGQSAPTATATATPPQAAASRFEFLVVESFDARYLGDTPGHLGRAGSGRVAPRLALGDPVMRGATAIGEVTHLDWNEARESLEVEFNPKPGVRVGIGEPVWVPIPR